MKRVVVKFENYFNKFDDDKKSNEETYRAPRFLGKGTDQFSLWVNKYLKYPKYAKQKVIEGKVKLRFTIDTDGRIVDMSVIKGVYPLLDKEAIRVVSSSPRWKPGTVDGKPIRVTYTFPIIFMLM